jgi:hypothetical protein
LCSQPTAEAVTADKEAHVVPAMASPGPAEGPELPSRSRRDSSNAVVLEDSSADGRTDVSLPIGTLDLTQANANLHLRLRVSDVLACTETMWEWVLKFQDAGLPFEPTPVQRAVAELSRSEFDRLLRCFQ